MIYLTRIYEQYASLVIRSIEISLGKLCAWKIGFPEGKQSGMSESTIAVGQYNEIYAPVSG